jgi:hypothetical protein
VRDESAAPKVNCEVLVAQFNVMQKTLQSLVQAQQKQPRKRLEYDQLSPPRKIHRNSRKLVAPFDHGRTHGEEVPESDDTESVSAFGSQCLSRTPRKKVQAQWVFIASRAKPNAPNGEREIDEWLSTYTTAEFKNAGEHAFYVSKKHNLSPFKQTHVRMFSFLVRRVDVLRLTFIFTTDVRFEKQGWFIQDSV